MRIIYQLGERAAVIVPAAKFLNSLPKEWSEEERLTHLADKELPTGTEYEIVDEKELPPRDFRDAWEFTAGEGNKESQELDVESKVRYRKELTKDEAKQYEAIRAEKKKELEDANIN